MNWIDFVKLTWMEATDKQAEILLWNCTCFPFCSAGVIKKQLKKLYKKSKGNFDEAIKISGREINEIIKDCLKSERV